jgi:hypothetical protein
VGVEDVGAKIPKMNPKNLAKSKKQILPLRFFLLLLFFQEPFKF